MARRIAYWRRQVFWIWQQERQKRHGGGGPTIELSSATIAEDASIGDDLGTASASGTTGTATWALDDDDGGKYTIDSSTGLVEVADALLAGTDSITISVSGLTPAPDPRTFLLTVTAVGGGGSPEMKFNAVSNSQYIALLEDI